MTPTHFIAALQAMGWVALAPAEGHAGRASAPIPAAIPAQLSATLREQLPVPLPSVLHAWCAAHGGLHNAAHTVWFYGLDDYAGLADSAFAWDFFEQLSLDAAMSERERQAVQAFWRAHVPFAASVAGDYAYLALREDGAVVCGVGPEFEASAEQVADALPRFCEQFIAHLSGQARDARLQDFG